MCVGSHWGRWGVAQLLPNTSVSGVTARIIGNLPVNLPKLLGPFQKNVPPIFDVYMFGVSFYITSSTKKSENNSLNCVFEQINTFEST